MLTTTARYDELKNMSLRNIGLGLRISFDRAYNDETQPFTLDESLLDGPDILIPDDDTPIQMWDFYKYQDYSDRLISMTTERSLDFPYSITSAMADFKLNNYDNYFTPNSDSPVGDYIIPNRPFRLLGGFRNELLPQFVGTTEKMPVISDNDKTVDFHAMDFLSQLYNMETSRIIAMTNIRTDEVLTELFKEFGLLESMFDLDEGVNVIPFLFYERGTKAGVIMRDLMEAEIGNLYLDELGKIRFDNRYKLYSTPSSILDEENIIDIRTVDADDRVNKVIINSDVRELKEFQPVWSMVDVYDGTRISSNSTLIINVPLDDPCLSVTNPINGLQYDTSWFIAKKVSDETPVTSGVSVTGQSLKATEVTLFFENTNAFPVYISDMEVWGEPAKIVDTIRYTEINQSSINKYGEEKVLEINNPFIQSLDQCKSIALPILYTYGEYTSKISMTVKGDFARQINDVFDVDYKEYTGDYKIYKIVNVVQDGGFRQILELVSTFLPGLFTLDESLLDGPDVLGI